MLIYTAIYAYVCQIAEEPPSFKLSYLLLQTFELRTSFESILLNFNETFLGPLASYLIESSL